MFKNKFGKIFATLISLSLIACTESKPDTAASDRKSGAALAAKFPNWVRIEYTDPETGEFFPSYRIYGTSEDWPDHAFEYWADCGNVDYGFNSVILWPTRMRTKHEQKKSYWGQVPIIHQIDSGEIKTGKYDIGFDKNHIYFINGDEFLAATAADSLHIKVNDVFRDEIVNVDFKMPKDRPFLDGFLEECDAVTKSNDVLREKYEAR